MPDSRRDNPEHDDAGWRGLLALMPTLLTYELAVRPLFIAPGMDARTQMSMEEAAGALASEAPGYYYGALALVVAWTALVFLLFSAYGRERLRVRRAAWLPFLVAPFLTLPLMIVIGGVASLISDNLAGIGITGAAIGVTVLSMLWLAPRERETNANDSIPNRVESAAAGTHGRATSDRR